MEQTSDRPQQQTSVGSPSIQLRTKFVLTGVVLPLACFVVAALNKGISQVETPWQSGRAVDHVAMLLQWPGFAPFLPFVVFSAVSLVTWCLRQDTATSKVVRLGIYTGILVSIQFMIFVLMTSFVLTWIFGAVMGSILAVVVYVCFPAVERAKRFAISHLLGLTALVAVLVPMIKVAELDVVQWLSVGSFLFLVAAPSLAPVTYIRASWYVYKQSSGQPMRTAGIWAFGGWLAAWLLSWRLAVALMLDEYSKLPTTNPNCYVCSAAAGGHSWLVGSKRDPVSGGIVSSQMQRLKFLELALNAGFPISHAALRAYYDRHGPRFGNYCRRSVWLADLSYLILKPIEWIAIVVRLIAKIDVKRVQAIYVCANRHN
ncbi:MAG: DUF6688 family protein [Pirellulaceae bacterium]